MRVGIDLGSTDIKVASVTPQFEMETVESLPLPTEREGDRVIHHPDDVLDQLRKIPELVSRDEEWEAAITSQRSTFILWDNQTGEPQTPLISWRDRRAENWVEQLSDDQFKRIQQVTGLRPEAGYPLPKLMHCFETDPSLRQLADKDRLSYGSLDSWLVWTASGGDVHVMDETQASRTLFYDPVAGTWSDTIVDEYDIPRSILPDLISHVETPIPADELWTNAHIVALVGDQPASTIGGQRPPYEHTRVTLGTGGFVASPCEPSTVPESLTLSFTPTPPGSNRVFQAEGVVLSAGRAVDWARDILDLSRDDVNQFMEPPWPEDIPMWCPALNGVGAPFWSNRPGAIRGFNEDHSRREITLGLIVSILFRINDILEQLPDRPDTITLDGGLSRVTRLPELAVSLWNSDIERAKTPHLTCRGALVVSEWSQPYFEVDPWESVRSVEVTPAQDVPTGPWTNRWHQSLEEWGLQP